jgi:hypothetical protein
VPTRRPKTRSDQEALDDVRDRLTAQTGTPDLDRYRRVVPPSDGEYAHLTPEERRRALADRYRPKPGDDAA